MNTFRLDDLYKMVAHIYSEQNLARSASATFAHFVEVCGMLTIHDRKKKREGLTVADALCKALGWYFPLMAKLKVRSVEDLIYRKFPYACPYCRLTPHVDAKCKLVRGTTRTVDHATLSALYTQNSAKRPKGLNDWQRMFQDIYPREAEDRGRSTIGLLEELGELAEAVRVFDKHPKYFVGEAADTFSYLMGIANEHAIRLQQDEDKTFSFEDEFLKQYPGLCIQCGSHLCVCPAVPEATVGRMAKELDIGASESLFTDNPESFAQEGQSICNDVLETVGGYTGLLERFPFDRGDANQALVVLCLRIAEAVQSSKPELAQRLRAEAIRIASSAAHPGSPKASFDVKPLLEDIKQTWRELDPALKIDIKRDNEFVEEIGDILGTIRVLFVSSSPKDEKALRVAAEQRAIAEALKLGKNGNKIVLTPLPAATIDDLRRALLAENYEIVHFSGHANEDELLFEMADGKSSRAPLTAVATLIRQHPSIKCVILNACESIKQLTTSISPCTIGMDNSIDDDAAIEFSRGFYDALAAGRSLDFAIRTGMNAVELKDLDASPIKVLRS